MHHRSPTALQAEVLARAGKLQAHARAELPALRDYLVTHLDQYSESQ